MSLLLKRYSEIESVCISVVDRIKIFFWKEGK